MSEKTNCITLLVEGKYKAGYLEKKTICHDGEQNADIVRHHRTEAARERI